MILTQMTFEEVEGEILKTQGMQVSKDHADEEIPSWSDDAFRYFKLFLGNSPATFMGEDVRGWSESHGLAKPPSARAWGSVVYRASRIGLIEHCGYSQVKNPGAHRANASVWKRKTHAI